MATATKNRVGNIGGTIPTNGAAATVASSEPYAVEVKLRGSSDLLFHRWNCESVDEKAKAAKGSKAKKTDDIESYVYRLDNGEIGIPGEYLRQAIIHAAKFRQRHQSHTASNARRLGARVRHHGAPA